MFHRPGCRHLAIVLLFAASSARAATLPTNFSDQLVASGLTAPTSLAFLPDGRALVTEQGTGRIRMVVGNTVTGALTTVPSLNTSGYERGLLSIAVDPDWPQRPYVYVHYTQTGNLIRIARFTGVGTLTGGTSTNLTLTDLHLVLTGVPDNAENHNGGSLRFGPDGMLYVSLGEDASPCNAQSITSLRGCVLRMDVSRLPGGAGGPPSLGEIAPADNPFASNPNAVAKLTYAIGLRNPFRFQIDPATGLLYVADVGEGTWEELAEVDAGENQGWPCREGPSSFGSSCTPLPNPVYDPPIDSYDHSEGPVIIAAGIVRRASGSHGWPAGYEGRVLFGDYYTGWLRMIGNDGSGWERVSAPGQPGEYWATGLNTPVDFQWGPDGHLWWLSQSAGQLRRIVHTGTVAVDPTPASPRLALAAAPNPARGQVELGFDLPSAGRVRIGVYDLSGRRIATLADEWRGAGRHALRWNGRDGSGRPAQAGVYLVRLEHENEAVTSRVTRLD
jgi:glucose/arabinose dehydrogenase